MTVILERAGIIDDSVSLAVGNNGFGSDQLKDRPGNLLFRCKLIEAVFGYDRIKFPLFSIGCRRCIVGGSIGHGEYLSCFYVDYDTHRHVKVLDLGITEFLQLAVGGQDKAAAYLSEIVIT